MKFSPIVQKWTIVVSAMVASLFIIFLGIYARNTVLEANPCQMTYSKLGRTELPLCGKTCEYKLYKISNPNAKTLNPQPVLYIPGHLGSANQARSLASYMHDDTSYFQYFALDFNEGFSAFHGGDVFAQAQAANKAIQKIVSMYAKKKDMKIDLEVGDASSSSRKVMLVGHSVGGMVARATALLSNHPSCAVRDIIQLSSPNVRPSYAPDASVETAYEVINQAWISVYRNSSAALERCNRKDLNTSSPPEGVQLTCPVCLASMRLVSLTGGSVDQEVPAALTDLNKLFPVPALPRPPAAAVAATTAPNWYFRSAKGALNAVIGTVRSLLASSTGGSNSTAAPTVNATDVSTEYIDTEAAGVAELGAAEVSVVGVDGTSAVAVQESEQTAAEAVTEVPQPEGAAMTTDSSSSVAAEMTNTPEPSPTSLQMPPTVQFLSLRTSQLQGVGFPIDHAAVVWCFDLLQVVTAGLRKLSKPHNQGLAPTDWARVFPLTEQAARNKSVSASLGSYEDHLQQRRHAQQAWTAAAHSESVYVTSKLPWPGVLGLAFDFVSIHLLKIVACYLLVSSLILTAPILRTLTGNSTGGHFGGASNWDALLPWNHFNVDLLHAAVFTAIKTSVPPTMWRQIFTACYQLALFGVIVKAAYDYFFGTFEIASYAVYLHWTVAYFTALAIRAVLLALVQTIHTTSVVLRGTGRTILRYTVWCKPIRRSVRGALKSVQEVCAQRLPFYDIMQRSVGLCVVLALWLSVWIMAQQHLQASGRELDRMTFGLSVLTLVSFALLGWTLLVALFWPVNSIIHKKSHHHHHHHHVAHKTSPYHVDLLLLYFPALLLALPMAHYSYRLLFGSSIAFPAAAEIFGVFAQDQAVVVLATISVAAHLYAARFSSALPANVKALRWMQEAVGPVLLLDYTDVFGATYTESVGAGARASSTGAGSTSSTRPTDALASGLCLHEDGGKFAIFEEVLVTEQGVEKVEVADGVVLGSTYRVISCNCAKDRSLADQTEYCSWCRCRRCGGKNLPPDRTRYYTHAGAERDLAELPDLSTDLLPVAALLLSIYLAGCFVEHSPYVYLRILGLTAAAFVSREVAHALYGTR